MGGEVTGTMTKRKKKGRPSLLELQKRSLKQQQLQEQQHNSTLNNPNSLSSTHRSTRRNPNLDDASPPADWTGSGGGGGGEDDDDERRQKKHKLLLGLNSSRNHQHYPISSAQNSASYGSDSNADGEDPEAALKRRKISTVLPGSDQTGEKVPKATDTLHGSPVESGPTTPLPDKKLLVFILDRLQKKDTYGVFSEPVDPEELPDYHDIIAHPMDFGTVRNKLDGGVYSTLEQFEKDVLLICSNAMQYNSPDTIYFRQARSMQALAKRDFENLRQESDGEPQPKVVRRGRPPGKSVKKSIEPSSFDRLASEFSSDATLATGGDTSSWSNTYNLRKGNSSYKLRPSDTLFRGANSSQYNETYASWLSEWENEFPASVIKAVMKYGKKHFSVDENRRDTYNYSSAGGQEQPVFTTVDGEPKQLIPVGLSSEHGYARSLARFAAGLGPHVWKVVSKKIEGVLPAGVKYGPGWVGENGDTENHKLISEKQKSVDISESENHSSKLLSPGTSGLNPVVAGRLPLPGGDMETVKRLGSQSEFSSVYDRSNELKGTTPQLQHRPLIHSRINGFSGSYGINYSNQMGLLQSTPNSNSENTPVPSQMHAILADSSSTICPVTASDVHLGDAKLVDSSTRLQRGSKVALGDESMLHRANDIGLPGKLLRQGLSPQNRQEFHAFPPDLNVRFLTPGSPSSMGMGSPQQPDLALQL